MRRANVKWLLFVLYVGAALTAFYKRELLMAWIKAGGDWQVAVAILIVFLFALFPVLPYGVVGALIGAVHGFLLGGTINWLGAWFAALVMFWLVRDLFAERGRRMLARYPQVERFNRLVEHNAFLAILFARLIPIFPSPVVNVYTALVRVPFRTFATASALGKIPVMLIFAFVGDQFFVSWRNIAFGVLVYALFLGGVFLLYRWWSCRTST